MKIPLSSYRIQFNPSFGFEETEKIIPYLKNLGISDIYASPILEPKTGSKHGYDLADFSKIDPQLGGEKAFYHLAEQIKKAQLGWIQDIVPNHMAYHPSNPFLYDVLEKGQHSIYSEYFDINWQIKDSELKGKLLFPFLEKPLENCLQEKLLQLIYSDTKKQFFIHYRDFRLPLKQQSFQEILSIYIDLMPQEKQNSIPVKGSAKILWLLDRVNKNNSELSYLFWQRLLATQNFLLSYWKNSGKEINYRRFFSINELICLKIETRNVFDEVHRLILQEVRQGNITGLRIDHLDGLFNPKQYLKKLRKEVPDTYTVVEKILQPDEMMLSSFSTEGNTGYDFLYYVNHLFCQKKTKTEFLNSYHSFINQKQHPDQLLLKKKRLILKQQMYSDLKNIVQLFYDYYQQHLKQSYPLLDKKKMLTALQEMMIRLPVYRTYISPSCLNKEEINQIIKMISQTEQAHPGLKNELKYISFGIFNPLLSKKLTIEKKKELMKLIMRWQQFTGPLMAKGMEDTLLYCYHPLISLNEVGGEPEKYGITKRRFYSFMKKRRQKWPYSMNASTTHDTKRGEDIRARINVLSEIPEYWQKKLNDWHQLNLSKKIKKNSLLFPDKNMENFLYQTLIGTLPFAGLTGINDGYLKRIQQYLLKSAREAKIYTSWINPYKPYEEILTAFTANILESSKNRDNLFLSDLLDFHQYISFYGLLNSLSQLALKLTCPGIPDFYQGSELWDLRLVDPDNRRPIDYNDRINMLQEIKTSIQNAKNNIYLLKEFLSKPENGKIKLFIIYQLLQLRNREPELFLKGSFIPLSVQGKYKDNIIAYLRTYKNKTLITIVPRFCTKIVKSGQYPLGNKLWKNTSIELPKKTRYSGLEFISQQPIRLAELTPIGNIFRYFPIAVILTDKEN